jgi:cell shape-determining protein MreC
MSQLGKNLLYVALAGAIVAALAGVALIHKHSADAATLAQVVQEKQNSDQEVRKEKAETLAAQQAKEASDKQLADATANISDLKNQLTTAQKQAIDAAAAVTSANDAAKTAKDALDAINKTLNGKSPDELVATAAKAQSDLQAALAEQKILQDNLQAQQQQVTDLQVAINNSKTGKQPPGISGKVTFVDHAWNFVILDVGLSNGVVPNGELIVYRGRNFLGKVRVTKVDPNDAVAEILPDAKGDIQIGDAVLN